MAPNKARSIPLEAIDAIACWVRDSGLRKIQFVWHGGEPLLAGQRFFDDVVRIQHVNHRDGLEYLNSVQTNGLLVDEHWTGLFRTGQFGIGLSLDGPAWVHDRQRRLPGGGLTHARVEESLRAMRAAGLSIGLSSVVTRHSLQDPRAILRYFDGLGVEMVDFLPMTTLSADLAEHPLLVTPKEFLRFMDEILDEWLALGDSRVMVRQFENIIAGICGNTPTLCTFSGRCGGHLSIDFDGSVYPCDAFMRYPEFRLGNVLENSLGDVLASSHYRDFRKCIMELPVSCGDCGIADACHGGCPFERYSRSEGHFHATYPFCETRQHLCRRITGMLEDFGGDALITRKLTR
jgi:uncharacterized protein